MKDYIRKLPFNWSNNKIYEYINDKVKSNGNIIKRMIDISNVLPYINIQETLDKTINLLSENNLMYSDDIKIIEFKKKLNRLGYKNYINTKIEAEFYGLFIFYLYQNEYSKFRINKELIEMNYKISEEQLFHNKEQLKDEVIKIENNERINTIEKLPLLEQPKAYLDLIKEFEKHQFLNKTNNYKRHIKFFKKCVKRLGKEIKINNNLIDNNNNNLKAKKSTPKDSKKISIREVALIQVFNNSLITRNNATEIVEDYGHKSGDRLYNLFTHYSSRANRRGKEKTKKKMQNKITLFEKVITNLEEPYKSRAEDELKILRISYKNEFS